jgi:hypothetical protein
METLKESVTTPPVTSSTGLFGTKIPSTTAFLIAILLFLLPFAEIKCNGNAIANNTGLGIAMGGEWKEVVSKNLLGDNSTNDKKEFNQSQDPNIFAIAAFAFGITGLLLAFLNFKGGGRINLFIGLLSAILLIAMLIDLKSKAKSDTSVKSSDLNLNIGIKITVDGTVWFYLAVILFLAAALFSWQKSKVTENQGHK